MFALKKDMMLLLLGGGFEAWFGLEENPPVSKVGRALLTGRATVLAFEKIFTGDHADYRGLFNHGFGVTLLDSSSMLYDGEDLLPNSDSRIKVIEARYILNLFERDEFRWYLNLKSGAGYVFEKTDGVPAHYLGLPLAIEGKFHVGGNLDNTLRCCFSYEPLLDFTSTVRSNIRASAEMGFGLGKYSNRVLHVGTSFDLRMLQQAGNTITGIPDIHCYLRLKLE